MRTLIALMISTTIIIVVNLMTIDVMIDSTMSHIALDIIYYLIYPLLFLIYYQENQTNHHHNQDLLLCLYTFCYLVLIAFSKIVFASSHFTEVSPVGLVLILLVLLFLLGCLLRNLQMCLQEFY